MELKANVYNGKLHKIEKHITPDHMSVSRGLNVYLTSQTSYPHHLFSSHDLICSLS